MRLLIVEDDRLLADGLYRSLTQMGFAVDVASDGGSADHMLVKQSYDLVILDLGLPELDGFEVLRKLRRRTGGTGTAPVLILTARDELEDRVRLRLDAEARLGARHRAPFRQGMNLGMSRRL